MLRRARQLLRGVNGLRSPAAPREVPLPLPDHLIALPSREGIALLAGSRLADAYVRLAPHYVPQEAPKFCGPATIAICLNALHLPPPSAAGPVRPTFTQRNIFTPETEALRPLDKVAREGMGLAVIADFFAAHGATAEVRFAEDASVEAFRSLGREVLADPQRLLVANYLRPALRQEGKGHSSPLAAYDEASDRFLVLDVSRVTYPPIWVRAEDLFAAMNTRAGIHSRGLAIVSRGSG